MDGTRTCPYCAETIQAAAVRCRYCRGRIAAFDATRWHRSHPERRIAGVTAALAHALALPLPAVRVGFVVLTFVHLLGPLLYGALWLVIPNGPGEPSAFERLFATLTEWIGRWQRPTPPPGAPNGADRSAGDAHRFVPAEPLS